MGEGQEKAAVNGSCLGFILLEAGEQKRLRVGFITAHVFLVLPQKDE